MKSFSFLFIAMTTIVFSCSDDESYQVTRCTKTKFSQECRSKSEMYESSGAFEIPCGQILKSIDSDGVFDAEMHCCYKITIKKDEDACCNTNCPVN